jgi:hypothetical protein
MDTLILAQDDQEIVEMLQQRPPKYPSGQGPEWSASLGAGGGIVPNLHLAPDDDVPYDTFPPTPPRPPGGMGPVERPKGTGSMKDSIVASIIDFADMLLQLEPYRLPHPRDVVQFRIIFIFHQTAAEAAQAIIDALASLPANTQWTTLPDVRGRALQVTQVWFDSCESGAEVTAHDPRLAKYAQQSANMRVAAQTGLRTEKKPPPSVPPEFFPVPYVYEFSTGDPVTGALHLHPNAIDFVTTPNWRINDHGVIEHIPDTPDPKDPSGGTVYKWGPPGTPAQTTDIPKGGGVNILANP